MIDYRYYCVTTLGTRSCALLSGIFEVVITWFYKEVCNLKFLSYSSVHGDVGYVAQL